MDKTANRIDSIDLSDFGACIRLMNEYGESETPFIGKNDCGETTMTSIRRDNIVMETSQNNGWIRKNVLWRDGTTEELYGR